MSQAEFEEKIAALKSRLHTLMMMRKGGLNIKRVKIEEHKVPGYTMPTHTRLIYSRKEKRAA